MLGLEYILSLYNMQHIELAEKLGIRKQNINMWIKGKQNIPKKYLPILEKLFKLDQKYFSKDLTQIDKLEIQKEKLKVDLKPVIKEYEQQFIIEEVNDIEKAKLVSRFKQALDIIDNNPYMDTYKLIVELLEKVQHEVVLHKTIEALAHYYEVLPDWVVSEPEQEQFEEQIFKVFDANNF